jgi:hypothetical protein
MQITLKALFDEETRKQIRDQVLGEARGVARAAIDQTINAEITRVVAALTAGYRADLNTRLNEAIALSVRGMVTSSWDKVKQSVDEYVEKAAAMIVARKLADKTVWEAKSQDAYIRQTVRSELKTIFNEKAGV